MVAFFPISVRADADVRFQFTLDDHSVTSVGDNGLAERVKGSMKLVLEDKAHVRFKVVLKSAQPLENPLSLANMEHWVIFPKGDEFEVNGVDEERATLLIPFEIKPPDGLVPGDYIGAMNAQVLSVNGNSLSSYYAKGITMKFTIPGQVNHSLSLLRTSFSHPEKDLSSILSYKVDSNVMIRPVAYVRALSPFREPFEETFVLPDITGHREQSFPIDISNTLPYVGWVDSSIRLTYSVLNFDGQVGSQVFEAGTTQSRLYVMPSREVFIIAGLVILGIGFILYRRRKDSSIPG